MSTFRSFTRRTGNLGQPTNLRSDSVKRGIYRCSTLRFLKHGKGKKPFINVKKDENWHNGLAVLEFRIVQNQIGMTGWPFEDLAVRVAREQRFCLDWDPAARLGNRKSAVWERRNRGIEE
ncbi:hypothetical protein AVEN_268741-1 [Araneus ventricosus]|uniref:Uncharacterized protein n=1 Tax=Araneus ventricosus TaxID=182803 RepID=A0A4Y2H380_ARAVE|nr:hypothetical protein AVEN_268741-1 [Araneus ventricosus]